MSRQVVLITGASSGIGRAAVLAFIAAGYDVAGIARRTERLTALAEEIAALPAPHGDFLPITGDVTQQPAVEAAIAQTLERFGRLDILIANAGIGLRGELIESSWQDIETLLHVNIDGVLHAIRAAVPAMKRGGGGHIMVVSSVLAAIPSPYAACYSASKAFISSLARSIRVELAPHSIRISDFLVGRTDTEFNEKRLGKGERKASRIPNMQPEQVAAGMVACARRPRNVVVLRWFDRLLLLANHLFPNLLTYLAGRQYR
ncbi:MAG: SDR family oxidoreductase [Anaerolinea sp.]